ncbi:adenylosuccinate lyase [Allomuricauda sp. d1]|uniref:adenylosuccinate lyase n=1 Tax=Allomuricauda sp. d1 TaxID=3136725 RepID=UPI0031D2FBD9
MTKDQLLLALNEGRLTKEKRDFLVAKVLQHPELVKPLLSQVSEEDKNDTFNGSWVLDNALRKQLEILLPHIDEFCTNLSGLRSESVIRPMAHICEMVVVSHFKQKKEVFVKKLQNGHLEKITECCFDWLIGNHKIATKVFAMTSLFHLGKKFVWIHPELKSVLEQTIATGTTGYQNRAAKTLNELKALGH